MKSTSTKANALREQGESAKLNTCENYSTGNSAQAQRNRLLRYLKEHGAITTLEARKQLDCLHPAMRVLELRAKGWRIVTVWVNQATDCGKMHRIARYVLQGEVAA